MECIFLKRDTYLPITFFHQDSSNKNGVISVSHETIFKKPPCRLIIMLILNRYLFFLSKVYICHIQMKK